MIANYVEKRINFELKSDFSSKLETGTVKKGHAICPCCGFVTHVKSVRKQLKQRSGGAKDALMFSVVCILKSERENGNLVELFDEPGRYYRLPTDIDLKAVESVANDLEALKSESINGINAIPDEPLPLHPKGKDTTLGFRVQGYGILNWSEIFSKRQLLSTVTLSKILAKANFGIADKTLENATKTCLAFAINKQAESNTSLCAWRSTSQDIGHTYGRQALPMLWDFVEANILSGATRDWTNAVEGTLQAITAWPSGNYQGESICQNATANILPDDMVDCFCSDPPYYDAVPYSDLSDLFYVWMRRNLIQIYPDLLANPLTNKSDECIVDDAKGKDKKYFEYSMQKAMLEGRRLVKPDGVGVIVFAHKSTSGWEAQLQAMIEAGWIFTGSWPIDTEMTTRLRAKDSAALTSSIHLVCRPREQADGTLIEDEVGDWRDVLRALPKRIQEWMPRLATEGVVGADAIFACLGPALEIFSQYSRVEKPNGDVVSLREYLEQVWAAVSQEALNQVFAGGDAKGFEEDARLTAMWLWTLSASTSGPVTDDDDDDEDDDDINTQSKKKLSGFVLDYDTARKIAQGLGADLVKQDGLIEVKGDKARLLPVSERTRTLFGQAGLRADPVRKKPVVQLALNFTQAMPEGVSEPEVGYELPELKVEETGKTVLDRLHQAMLLFDSGRTEALKRFLVEDGVGRDERFWKLAQALNALYPKDTPERRWVEAVQTFKKGLGL
ncbi:hypothetical protein GCM10028818_57340 [Spirosoma horti]